MASLIAAAQEAADDTHSPKTGFVCEFCRPFNLSLAMFTSSPYLEKRMHQLGSYGEVSARKNCQLCYLISKAYKNSPVPSNSGRDGARSCDLARVQGAWNPIIRTNDPRSALLIWLIPRDENVKIRLRIRPLMESDKPQPYFARGVEGPFIDVALLLKWLHRCEDRHTCSEKMGLDLTCYRTPADFRVIDVLDRCVVQPPAQCRYLTLSYIWGTGIKFQAKKSNISMLSTPGALGEGSVWEQLSNTIRDAILLTKKLGERYLWVDSLCIVQDSGDEAMRAIRDMDLVYKQSTLMICAADDRCSRDGLPGVHTTPRKHQPNIANVGSNLKIAAQFDMLDYVEHSIYNTRGWT